MSRMKISSERSYLRDLILIAFLSCLMGSAAAGDILKTTEQFRPDGKIDLQEPSKYSRSTGALRVETGVLNSTAYRFYYSDGSGSFSGKEGNRLAPGDELGSNWGVSCNKDPMTDRKSCIMHKKDLWITIDSKGQYAVTVGSEHFPGSIVTLRLDAGQPISTKQVEKNNFSPKASASIVDQLKRAKELRTRYMKWPNNYWVDDAWDLYGFNQTLEYVNWAVARVN